MSKAETSNPFAKKLLGAVFAIPLLVVGCGGKEAQAPGARAVPVKLQTLETSTLVDSTQYVGTLEARGRVNLAPRINGRILNIFVRQGDRVTQGQPIIELEPTQQQEDVNAATQAVNVQKATLAQTQAQLGTAEADRAAAAAEVERARADLQDREAEVKLAQINIERSEMLVKGGAQPQQDLDDKTRNLATTVAQRDSRKEALNSSIKSLDAAQKRVEQAVASIESQQAAVRQAESELGSVSQNLAFNTINAPISGIVGSFSQKKVGDFVNTGEQITTITDNQLFYLNISIPTEFRSQLKAGLPVKIIKKDGTDGITGRMTFISPEVDQDTQSILTKVTFQNDGSLRDREYVQVKVIWQENPGVLVPTRAVTTLGGQSFVYVAAPGESEETELVAKQQPIKVGTIQGQAYQVISGVAKGDRIAVTRILDLKDGTPITDASDESAASEQSLN
ncbi:RND family efflux transporter, MFP subunit [Xenococcus sp. PCC 7305]|uniref:efflux RND transporter periplasmic adaptor subunit n=1 Tax=Xenococcus sp. PCC 7305 TaxID=102125 RepID=UPI0002ACF023|nr:efflux RND transporter periplasmic adaptor subunit [Xenococcus sp. PCC 7305]ELS01893.1 RND family efflux transporter, MFP subunit [Xenococcus sp. PCC 7305]